jgi:hypothetical protein
MTFALALLGVVQMVWLPGWCLVQRFDLGRYGPRLVLAFALSQIVNYALVQGLFHAGLYGRPALLVVIAAEGFVAWRVGGAVWQRPVADYGRAAAGFLGDLLALGRGSLAARLLVVLAVLCAAFYLACWAFEVGRVFRGWDDVQAWNRWAVEWATGEFASVRGFYPHLLPINWSLVYVLAGDTRMEFFPKAVMPAYATLMLYLLAWRAVRLREPHALAGLVFLAAAIPLAISWIFLYGYADVPAAFCGLVAVHVALECVRTGQRGAMLLAAILAAGASLTKASGLIAAVCVVLLVSQGLGVRRALQAAALLALLTLPHYVSRGVEQFSRPEGLGAQERLLQLTGLGPGGQPEFTSKPLATRLIDAAGLLVRSPLLDKLIARAPEGSARLAANALAHVVSIAAALCLLLALGALADPTWRPILLVVVLPYALIWALIFGYDMRNVVPLLPQLALCLNVGLARLTAGASAWRGR